MKKILIYIIVSMLVAVPTGIVIKDKITTKEETIKNDETVEMSENKVLKPYVMKSGESLAEVLIGRPLMIDSKEDETVIDGPVVGTEIDNSSINEPQEDITPADIVEEYDKTNIEVYFNQLLDSYKTGVKIEGCRDDINFKLESNNLGDNLISMSSDSNGSFIMYNDKGNIYFKNGSSWIYCPNSEMGEDEVAETEELLKSYEGFEQVNLEKENFQHVSYSGYMNYKGKEYMKITAETKQAESSTEYVPTPEETEAMKELGISLDDYDGAEVVTFLVDDKENEIEKVFYEYGTEDEISFSVSRLSGRIIPDDIDNKTQVDADELSMVIFNSVIKTVNGFTSINLPEFGEFDKLFELQ